MDRMPRLLVEEHTVKIPNRGATIDDWTYLVTPDFINILPVTPEGEFLVFRQVKYAVGLQTGRDTHNLTFTFGVLWVSPRHPLS